MITYNGVSGFLEHHVRIAQIEIKFAILRGVYVLPHI